MMELKKCCNHAWIVRAPDGSHAQNEDRVQVIRMERGWTVDHSLLRVPLAISFPPPSPSSLLPLSPGSDTRQWQAVPAGQAAGAAAVHWPPRAHLLPDGPNAGHPRRVPDTQALPLPGRPTPHSDLLSLHLSSSSTTPPSPLPSSALMAPSRET